MLQEDVVVGSVANRCTVLDNQVVMTKLGKSSNNLLGNVGLLVDSQRKVQVVGLSKITKLLRAVELALLVPLLDEVPALLAKDRTGQLQCLLAVQAALVKQRAEVLQKNGDLARLGRN